MVRRAARATPQLVRDPRDAGARAQSSVGQIGEARVVREDLDDRLAHAEPASGAARPRAPGPTARTSTTMPSLAGACGATGAVHVALLLLGRVEVDDDVDVVDVDAAGGDVGRDEHPVLVLLEVAQRLLARGLAQVAVDRAPRARLRASAARPAGRRRAWCARTPSCGRRRPRSRRAPSRGRARAPSGTGASSRRPSRCRTSTSWRTGSCM